MEALAQLAVERSQIYWLLSRFYLSPPEAAFLVEFVRGASSDRPGEPDVIDCALEQLQRSLGSLTLEQLQREHLRLFSGVREGYGPPPPFESLHREGRMMGQSTESVIRHYRSCGFSFAHETVGPEDHLGLELKFLALMCHEESRRWRDGNATAACAALAAQQQFIDEHLHAWAPAYCELVQGDTPLAYYRAVCSLTTAVIEQDACRVAALLDEQPAQKPRGGLQ